MDLREQMKVVSACNCRITELYREWARKNGISYNTLMILYALRQEGPHTQIKIAEEWMLPKQSVHSVVKDLERQGLVYLASGRDQKEKVVCFTPEGCEYADRVLEKLYEMEDRVMLRMGAETCQYLVDGNVAFAQALADEVLHG